MRTLKFIVERHSDGYLAYPLGLRGVVMGQGGSRRGSAAGCEIGSSGSYWGIRVRGLRRG